MKYAVIAATLIISGTVQAQTLIDEPQGVEQSMANQIVSAVADHFADPVATQIRRLRPSEKYEGTICGEVNTKNQYGGYVGFKPFRYLPQTGRAYFVNTGCE